MNRTLKIVKKEKIEKKTIMVNLNMEIISIRRQAKIIYLKINQLKKVNFLN
jgi:hypothetical protein